MYNLEDALSKYLISLILIGRQRTRLARRLTEAKYIHPGGGVKAASEIKFRTLLSFFKNRKHLVFRF